MEDFIDYIFQRTKENAIARDITINIIKEDIFDLYRKQSGACALTNTPLTHIRKKENDDERCICP